MKKNLFAVLILTGLIIYGGFEYFHQSSESSTESLAENLEIGIAKGQLAPDFVLTDLQGNAVHLSDFKGKKVFLNFWASWCPPCRAEMPHMQKFYEKYQSKDIVILAVNLIQSEKNPKDVYTFVQEQQLTFPIVLDQKGEVATTYQIYLLPTTFLLDADGVIREKFQGPIHYDIMKKAVSKIK